MLDMEQRSHSVAEVSTSLPAVLSSQSTARRFVGDTLRAWGRDGVAEDAVQIASELVANVLRHTVYKPILRLRLTGTRLRLEVEDSSSLLPVRKAGGPLGGWGLTLVDQLSDSWGVRTHPAGKVVWCEIDTERTPVGAY